MPKAPPETCPVCGADVPPRAQACPSCGSDHSTGWSERAQADHLGLPDGEFDHDEFVRNEFGAATESRIKPRGVNWLWWTVALLLVAAMVSWLWR
jgi:hypothetical protein